MANGLLDLLVSMMSPDKPKGGSGGSLVPAQVPMGSGLAGSAADLQSLYPQWKQLAIEAQLNGGSFPPFNEWVAMQSANTAALPR